MAAESASAVETCDRIYATVKLVGQDVEKVQVITEEARKLHRLIKRTELLVSDLQPYCKPGLAVWATLKVRVAGTGRPLWPRRRLVGCRHLMLPRVWVSAARGLPPWRSERVCITVIVRCVGDWAGRCVLVCVMRQEVESVLNDIRTILFQIYAKGSLATYLQAGECRRACGLPRRAHAHVRSSAQSSCALAGASPTAGCPAALLSAFALTHAPAAGPEACGSRHLTVPSRFRPRACVCTRARRQGPGQAARHDAEAGHRDWHGGDGGHRAASGDNGAAGVATAPAADHELRACPAPRASADGIQSGGEPPR